MCSNYCFVVCKNNPDCITIKKKSIIKPNRDKFNSLSKFLANKSNHTERKTNELCLNLTNF